MSRNIQSSRKAGVIFRDARPADRDEVLEWTASTWEFGDYIQWVYDRWLADSDGRFMVGEEMSSGRVIAIDKLTVFSPGECWFEGLRVHPDFRGQGIAARFQEYMIGEARRLGAKSIRFLTLLTNTPVHRNAFRDGFSMRFVVRDSDLKLADLNDQGVETKPQAQNSPTLRRAREDEAASLYEWWRRSPSCAASDGLIDRGWAFGSTSADDWAKRAARGELLVPEGLEVERLAVPPPLALVSAGTDAESHKVWVISALSAPGMEWLDLSRALVVTAAQEGIERVHGLVPDTALALKALSAAGFVPDEDESCLAVFELLL